MVGDCWWQLKADKQKSALGNPLWMLNIGIPMPHNKISVYFRQSASIYFVLKDMPLFGVALDKMTVLHYQINQRW